MPEIIYTGKEENLADILIERLVDEKEYGISGGIYNMT